MAGNYHFSGKCVSYALPPKRKFGDDDATDKRNHKSKSYSMNQKNKQRVKDGATYQNHVASKDPNLSHTFFTLTYHKNDYLNANIHVSDFFDKLKKHSKRVYPEIADNFSYIWVRELTKKGVDHFHCMCVLPVFTIPKKQRKHDHIIYSIPYYYDGEQESKYFSLNKAWCRSRGYYSKNAVRISQDRNGKKLFIINDIVSAIRYVSKYISKGQTNDKGELVKSQKPIVRMSQNLTKWTKPLPFDDVLQFAYDRYYGDCFVFRSDETKELVEKKVIVTDFATIGKVQLTKSAELYFKLQQELVRKNLQLLENEARTKKISLKMERLKQSKQEIIEF